MTRVLWPPFKLLFKALTVPFPAALVVAALVVATVATAASLLAAVAGIAPGVAPTAPRQAAPPLRPPPRRARLRPLCVAGQFERPTQQPLWAHRTQIAGHRLAVADAVQRQGAARQHVDHTA